MTKIVCRTPQCLAAVVLIGLLLSFNKTARAEWNEYGIASWYGPGFVGRPTASTEIYDPNALTAAHKTLPLGTLVRVHNLDNGRRMVVRINDRGPFVDGRIIDLSRAAAEVLGFKEEGLANVLVEKIPRDGQRTPSLTAFKQTLERLAAPDSPMPDPDAIALLEPNDEIPDPEDDDRPSEVDDLSPNSSPEGYFVQIGAYSGKVNAERRAKRARLLDVQTRVVQQDDVYRVLVGPFSSFSEASFAQRDLERSGIEGFLRAATR